MFTCIRHSHLLLEIFQELDVPKTTFKIQQIQEDLIDDRTRDSFDLGLVLFVQQEAVVHWTQSL